ncbi:MAG: hypothetical protein KatS3mg110_2448 [Pirellulaceae bacterium]|nr:MAG: hypothetical protein KatS3mg110_2448 [Pirellulaceae bacterium]
MRRTTRRKWIQGMAAGFGYGLCRTSRAQNARYRLGTFAFDVSPPLGHSLCGGWIKPAQAYDDRLEAIGFVLLGAGEPIVVCAVDWTGICNSAHVAWRKAMADAVGTAPERVAVQSVHQHNAPFACLDAQQIVAQYPELPSIVDVEFFEQCLQRARNAVQEAVQTARPLTHLAVGQAVVEKVASNRRIVDGQGKLVFWRGSSSKDPRAAEYPEGLIDPQLRTVAFFSGDEKLVACHYYATHPMSYYGDGRVSSDFVGLARKRRQQEEPHCRHVYFTGCAGNVAAGKYNDGSPPLRQQLADRVYDAMRRSEDDLRLQPIDKIHWMQEPVLPPPRSVFNAEQLREQIAQPDQPIVARNRPSYTLAWLERVQRHVPIVLSALHVNSVSLLHLPAECFVEYQLFAHQAAPDRFVAVAAYGDGGPWYIPTEEAYPQGGYEVSVAFCDPPVDRMLRTAIRHLLAVS